MSLVSPTFLYLHEGSAVDLYLKALREAVDTIPKGLLQVEFGGYTVISDYTDSRNSVHDGIVLGYGFNPSFFKREGLARPRSGLLFCLNPPFINPNAFENLNINFGGNDELSVKSSFMVGKNRFILTSQEFNLDKIVCGELRTGRIFGRS